MIHHLLSDEKQAKKISFFANKTKNCILPYTKSSTYFSSVPCFDRPLFKFRKIVPAFEDLSISGSYSAAKIIAELLRCRRPREWSPILILRGVLAIFYGHGNLHWRKMADWSLRDHVIELLHSRWPPKLLEVFLSFGKCWLLAREETQK